LKPQIRVRRERVRPAAQHIAAGNIKVVMNDSEEIGWVTRIECAEDLMDVAPVSIALEGHQVLVRDIPIDPETPTAQLPRIIGIGAVWQRGIVPVQIGTVNAEKRI